MSLDALTLTWQRVEEEEAEITEMEKVIVAALNNLGQAKAREIAQVIGLQRSNTSRKLQQMWKEGKVHMEMVRNIPHCSLKEQEVPNGQVA